MHINLFSQLPSYAVNVLSQFMSDPREVHQVVADRVLAYLKNIVGQGLFVKRGEDIQLSVYTDADFGGNPVDRRSTT